MVSIDQPGQIRCLLIGGLWCTSYFCNFCLSCDVNVQPTIEEGLFLAMCLTRKGIQNMIHYLDDFLMVEAPASKGHTLSMALTIRESLGVPVAPNKFIICVYTC